MYITLPKCPTHALKKPMTSKSFLMMGLQRVMNQSEEGLKVIYAAIIIFKSDHKDYIGIIKMFLSRFLM